MRFRIAALLLALHCLIAAGAQAQHRPLATHDPEPVGKGRMVFEVGGEAAFDVTYSASGLVGDLVRAPMVGVIVGLGSIAELQVRGSLWEHLAIERRFDAPLAGQLEVPGDSTSGVGTVVVATKVRIVPERASRPALGLRFATRLPTSSNENGLGLDTTDFSAALLVGKSVGATRLVGTLGLGILGDPTRGDRQNDVVEYGGSVSRAVGERLALVLGANGRVNVRHGTPPPGTDTSGIARAGIRVRAGRGLVDAAVLAGLTQRDPSVGFTAGYTIGFDAFTEP